MKEYKATLHGYEITTPPRCKLERLEPVTEEITLPLHYADAAPVAMRVSGSLEYTGKDGNRYTWRDGGKELRALDGLLWKRCDSVARWHDEPWTIEELADHCAGSRRDSYFHNWPWQWSDAEPPRGLLVRDKGTWATIENLKADALASCDRYAVIAGELYEPARELVYTYSKYNGGWFSSRESGREGSVIVAEEYDTREKFTHYLCNALQDWREVNVYDEHTERIQDKMFNEVSGADVIEVLMPEFVKSDPYADFWREEIRRHKEKAANSKQAAKEHAEKARALREDAKRDREAASRELEHARKLSEKLDAYLTRSEA